MSDDLMRRAEARWTEGYRQGPRNLRWTSVPLQAGDPAPDLELPDHEGNQRTLSSFWAHRPALVLLWRQFGCSCGQDRARRLAEEMPQYEEAGAEVVIVGQGEPERAATYRERFGLTPPVLSDPGYRAYEAYGILEGKPSQILFDAPDDFLRLDPQAGDELVAGRRDTERALVDNPWLLPGEFVVGTDGIIRLAYRWQYCEDYPDPRVHVAAIKEARGQIWSPDA
jgi:peroxiredoxin